MLWEYENSSKGPIRIPLGNLQRQSSALMRQSNQAVSQKYRGDYPLKQLETFTGTRTHQRPYLLKLVASKFGGTKLSNDKLHSTLGVLILKSGNPIFSPFRKTQLRYHPCGQQLHSPRFDFLNVSFRHKKQFGAILEHFCWKQYLDSSPPSKYHTHLYTTQPLKMLMDTIHFSGLFSFPGGNIY